MVTGKLEGRRILLTGVSRGVGLATARLFLDEGATVLGVARDEVRLRNARAELGARALGRFEALSLDLAAADAPARAAAWIGERWGALDVLWNNAGVMLSEAPTFAEEPAGTLEATLANEPARAVPVVAGAAALAAPRARAAHRARQLGRRHVRGARRAEHPQLPREQVGAQRPDPGPGGGAARPDRGQRVRSGLGQDRPRRPARARARPRSRRAAGWRCCWSRGRRPGSSSRTGGKSRTRRAPSQGAELAGGLWLYSRRAISSTK